MRVRFLSASRRLTLLPWGGNDEMRRFDGGSRQLCAGGRQTPLLCYLGLDVLISPQDMKQHSMKRTLQMLAVPAAIAASFLTGCSTEKITDRTDPNRPSTVQVSEGYDTFGRKWGDQTNQPVLSRVNSVLLNYTGTITDIDYADREITLKDSQGRIETFVVDKSVERLNEAKVGDKVSVDYYLGFNAEVRKPTAAEEQNPLVVLEGAGRAGPDSAPAAGGLRQIRAVVTIEGLDRPTQTLTVKGPRGKYFVARVADPSRLEEVHIGETIVMTFTEAAAISLKPAGNGTPH
jgi:hypothetical protein